VLAEIRGIGVERVVVGGDVVPGPEIGEGLRILRAVDVRVEFIYGNGEVAVLEELAGRTPTVPEAVRPMIRWSAEQLTAEDVDLLRC
jgi:hypothetical protein